MHGLLSVAEAAARLSITESAVRQLAASGRLDTIQLAGRIVVPVPSLERLRMAPRPSGRPFSPTSSWALLRLLSGQTADGLPAPRRSQLRRHLREADPEDMAGRLRTRAQRQGWHVHPSLLPRLVADRRCVRSGLSALEESKADLVSDSVHTAELYVDAGTAGELAAQVAADVSAYDGNVVVHVVTDLAVLPTAEEAATPAVVALDLLESGEARAVAAGWKLWVESLSAWRAGEPASSSRRPSATRSSSSDHARDGDTPL